MRGTVAARPQTRKDVLDELAASEGRYVKRLRALIAAYLQPLHDARVLTAGELGAIFRGVTDMRDVHSKLNGVIQAASEDDSVSNGIDVVANEFGLAKAALLELYVPFARGHEAALRMLRTAMARPDVGRTVSGIASSDERVSGLSLEDLLCAPLDRIAEYRDLLTTLLSLSSTANSGGATSGSYAALSEAVELFSSIVREAVAAGYTLPSSSASSAASSAMAASAAATLAAAAGSNASANTRALVAAAMPMEAGGSGSRSGSPAPRHHQHQHHGSSALAGVEPGAHLTTEAVLAAQSEAEDAARRLEALEREVALKEGELNLTTREVARAEAEKQRRAVPDTAPLEEALRQLGEEERNLLAKVSGSEHRALFEAFLARKRELEEEEARLTEALEEHEDTLAKVRARLANPPSSVLPSDPAKASLYIAWKRALAEREELLRQARRRKHELLRDLKARHETQIVLLEMERRAAVEGLKSSVAAEREKVEAYRKDLAALDESIESARNAMTRFRQEFEQLRVALLIDRMAKSSQVANLADRRRRLAREAEQFAEAVEAAKQRVAAEEAAKWEAKLAAERDAGEARVAEERRQIETKIDKVRAALAERYEAGFKPLLAEAEARHVDELNKIVALQKELEAKEAELRAAHESARAVSAAVSSLTGQGNNDGQGGADEAASVPEWKLREFEDLRNAVATMWEQLDVPPEDVTAFLSECDLLAPFSPAVLGMYQDMYRRLTNAASAAAVAATAPAINSANSNSHSHAGIPQPLGYEGGADSSSSAMAASQRAGALADAYEEASQAAATRARAAANALLSPVQGVTMPQPAGAGRGNSAVSALAGLAAASNSAQASHNTAANAGFRSTLFSSSPAVGGVAKPSGNLTDDEIAYLNRLKSTQLPPSLGGPGARSQRGGSIHVSAGGDMVRRSPSPNARALAASLNAGLGGGR